jgi:uncharacterized protein
LNWEFIVIDLSTFQNLTDLKLDDFAPKPTSIERNQSEATRELFQSRDKTLEVGIWECTPGRFTADRSHSSEICHILSGRAEVRTLNGEPRALGPGDVLVLPQGWKGEWRIWETTRKLYVFHTS